MTCFQEYIDKNKELQQVNNQMAELKKTIGLTSLSLKELAAMLLSLTGSTKPINYAPRSQATLVRNRVDSVRETDVRLTLVACRLPEPETNGVIRDDRGRFLARGDLVYRRWKLVIEYDGWHHERDAEQRSKDIHRRERLEAAGWRVIVVTYNDMSHPISVVARVWEALTLAGYIGSAPVYDRARIRTLRDL